MKVTIGCPIRDRAWILPRYFEHLGTAIDHVDDVDVAFVFCGDPKGDRLSFKAIDEWTRALGCDVEILTLDEIYEPYRRVWNIDRYTHMARLRNTILRAVRKLHPDYFWSLDSDVLVHPEALASALDAIAKPHSRLDSFDAIGNRLYMTPQGTGTRWPSYAQLTDGGLFRKDAAGVFRVDVIMAAKLMTPKAYSVDYEPELRGEDIGWSAAAKSAGCRLGWDGRTISKHVMDRKELQAVDPRVGF